MSASRNIRRLLIGATAVLAIVVVSTAALILALDSGYGRGLLIRGFAWRTGRTIEVNGTLEAHLLSMTPQIVAEHVTIGNPPWTPPGTTAEVDKLTLGLKLPSFRHPPGIIAVAAQGTTLYLVRDAQGRANWQVRDPARPPVDRNSPLLRKLEVPEAHVILNDARRHLQFDGTVSALDLDAPGTVQPLRINGSGQLNGREVHFELTGEPLAIASHKSPYHFTFNEHSSGSRINGQGQLPRPFRFDILDATFKAEGPDLKDLYFLTGVHLVDTGEYALTGTAARRGKHHTQFNDLVVTSGSSDMRGSIAIDSSDGPPRLTVDLHSNLLKLSDLGIRAAGRTTEPKSPLLISDARLGPNLLRTGGAKVHFQAERLEVGTLPLQQVSADATIDRRVLTVESFAARAYDGRISGRMRLDGNDERPAASIDVRVSDVQLAGLSHKDPEQPPLEGPLSGHLAITGHGLSAHQIAATANGTLSIRISDGAMRKSLAELTGIDLRGLGMLLAGDKKEIPVRCAMGDFHVQDGTLIAQRLVLDTDRILITGEGEVHLGSEDLDLKIGGHPKRVRLFRVRAPLRVQGSLRHPSVHVETSQASLVVVDPGHAKDADCTGLRTAKE